MSSTLTLETRVVACEGQVSSNLDGEVVILGLDKGVYYGLDNVGVRVWELLQNPIVVGEIQAKLLEEFNVAEERCAADLKALLSRLLDEKLIEIED